MICRNIVFMLFFIASAGTAFFGGNQSRMGGGSAPDDDDTVLSEQVGDDVFCASLSEICKEPPEITCVKKTENKGLAVTYSQNREQACVWKSDGSIYQLIQVLPYNQVSAVGMSQNGEYVAVVFLNVIEILKRNGDTSKFTFVVSFKCPYTLDFIPVFTPYGNIVPERIMGGMLDVFKRDVDGKWCNSGYPMKEEFTRVETPLFGGETSVFTKKGDVLTFDGVK